MTQAPPPAAEPAGTDGNAHEAWHFGRTPPQAVDSEEYVLGAMLRSPAACAEAFGILTADDFYRPSHALIFEAAKVLFGNGEPVDAVTVRVWLQEQGNLGKAQTALVEAVGVYAIAANTAYHAKIVRKRAQLRTVIAAGTQMVQLAYADDGEADQIIAAAEGVMLQARDRSRGEDYVAAAGFVPEVLDEVEAAGRKGDALTGVPTGFADLDRLTNGLHPGQMIVVAARPAVGKSTLALDFVRAASITHGRTSVIFSLEMTKLEIGTRLVSAESRVALQNLRKGTMRADDWDRVNRALPRIVEAPLFVDDSPNLTMLDIRAKARRLKQEHDLQLVVVDYLQLMSSGGRVESRQTEVSAFSRAIKMLAKELEVPVVALSQLNRGPEQRTDKRPLISDLRESGSIEQDADMVILLHREDMYDKESPRVGEADLIVAKHRNGPTDTVTVAFQGHYSRFVDMAA